MGGACSMYESEKVFVGKCEGKIKFGRPMLWWQNNIKIDLKENRMEKRAADSVVSD